MVDKQKKLTRNEIIVFVIVFAFLVLLTLFTRFYGNSDVKDYADVSKFITGEYQAKIRSSHSYLFGFVHSPLVDLFNNFLIFKITSLIFLLVLILSVYYISGRNKKSLWLMLLSPIVWYMAPWISPIQLASLLFLWAFYFIKKYDETNSTKSLVYAGLLFGISWAFWDAILFFIPLLLISFFYNKKLLHLIYILIFIFIGALPRFIIDTLLFGFPLFTVARHILGSLALSFFGGFYGQTTWYGPIWLILVLLFIPFYSFLLARKNIFKENKKEIFFLILSTILLIINSQIRFTLLTIPIILVIIPKYMEKKQFTIQVIISLVLILLVVNPYLIQTHYDLGNEETSIFGTDFGGLVANFNAISVKNELRYDLIQDDLNQIADDFPNQIFIVGNRDDSYSDLAHVYWGENVKEFVSIQDYKLYLNNETTIAGKEFCSNVRISERRDICIKVYIRKAFSDNLNYGTINYAISDGDTFNIEGFRLIKKYKVLSAYSKE
ncbi:MAG: hypothetical protein AABW91_03520 [Nanoarchaeota archaeon]